MHWLDLTEAELCMGQFRLAAATAASCWVRSFGAQRTIAAWLGGVANALAGRRPHAWQHFVAFLDNRSAPKVTKSEWVTLEIEAYLQGLRAKRVNDPRRVAFACAVHQSFMDHYQD